MFRRSIETVPSHLCDVFNYWLLWYTVFVNVHELKILGFFIKEINQIDFEMWWKWVIVIIWVVLCNWPIVEWLILQGGNSLLSKEDQNLEIFVGIAYALSVYYHAIILAFNDDVDGYCFCWNYFVKVMALEFKSTKLLIAYKCSLCYWLLLVFMSCIIL